MTTILSEINELQAKIDQTQNQQASETSSTIDSDVRALEEELHHLKEKLCTLAKETQQTPACKIPSETSRYSPPVQRRVTSTNPKGASAQPRRVDPFKKIVTSAPQIAASDEQIPTHVRQVITPTDPRGASALPRRVDPFEKIIVSSAPQIAAMAVHTPIPTQSSFIMPIIEDVSWVRYSPPPSSPPATPNTSVIPPVFEAQNSNSVTQVVADLRTNGHKSQPPGARRPPSSPSPSPSSPHLHRERRHRHRCRPSYRRRYHRERRHRLPSAHRHRHRERRHADVTQNTPPPPSPLPHQNRRQRRTATVVSAESTATANAVTATASPLPPPRTPSPLPSNVVTATCHRRCGQSPSSPLPPPRTPSPLPPPRTPSPLPPPAANAVTATASANADTAASANAVAAATTASTAATAATATARRRSVAATAAATTAAAAATARWSSTTAGIRKKAENVSGDAGRTASLEEIRQGVKLTSASEREQKKPKLRKNQILQVANNPDLMAELQLSVEKRKKGC